MQIQDTTLQKQSCAELPPSHRTMEKLGCHTMLHALQHVKLSLPDKLIRKAISYTWLDIFPASFNNLYCIHKFTGCAVSLSPWPISAWPTMDTRTTCYHFQGHHNKCALAISHSFIANAHCSHAWFFLPSESGEWIIKNAIVKCFLWIMFCTAVACSAQDSLVYWYFSMGLLFEIAEPKSDYPQKGAAHFKPFLTGMKLKAQVSLLQDWCQKVTSP